MTELSGESAFRLGIVKGMESRFSWNFPLALAGQKVARYATGTISAMGYYPVLSDSSLGIGQRRFFLAFPFTIPLPGHGQDLVA